VIATNTTLDREGLHAARAAEIGGLSGAPLTKRSREFTARIHNLTHGRMPIVSVGGIDSPDEAQRRLDAGASLVQIYTGLVYSGPALASQIVNSLR
jgi:dihydroorotate dehydrogenase